MTVLELLAIPVLTILCLAMAAGIVGGIYLLWQKLNGQDFDL